MRKEDAVAARNRYNGVKLDGKPMIIGFVGVDLMTSFDPPPTLVGAAQADSNILFERYNSIWFCTASFWVDQYQYILAGNESVRREHLYAS